MYVQNWKDEYKGLLSPVTYLVGPGQRVGGSFPYGTDRERDRGRGREGY